MSVSSARLFEYLEAQQGTVFNRLYRQPSTALAVFRSMLTHLAKHLIMAMLYSSSPMAESDLDVWIRNEGKRERDNAISLLQRLHILRRADPKKVTGYVLTNPFGSSLRQALTGAGDHSSFGIPLVENVDPDITVSFLDDWARDKWESVLALMVGNIEIRSDKTRAVVSEGVKQILKDGKLVNWKGNSARITQEGFAFVLKETNAQVWDILILYLENAEAMQMSPIDILSFLFTLGSLSLGSSYSTANLTETQVQMLTDLSSFGLIFLPETTTKSTGPELYYPTRLATTLTSTSPALITSSSTNTLNPAAGDSSGYIIIETNYRLYAYTSSPLQIAILGLFTRLTTRYPNMVAGKLSRDSVRRAVAQGITADQIITYLTTYAHAQMKIRPPTLPPTVVDQIRLWQIEGERMKPTPGYLFGEFANEAEYSAAKEYAGVIGVLVWSSDAKRMFFVTDVPQLQQFLINRREKEKG